MSGGTWSPERRLLTVGLIGLVTAAAFEGMAVPTVLPALVDDLGGLDLYGWAFSAFWLTNLVGITLAGADTDRHGPARPFVLGALLFAAGMVIAGLAPSMQIVIVGRAIQGSGSGAISAVVYAVIARAYAPRARPRMIALTSSAWVVPGLVGPALAGIVTDAVGWRWVFLGVAPPVLLTAVALWRPLAAIGPATAVPAANASPGRSDSRRAFDAVQLSVGSAGVLAAFGLGSLPAALGVGIVGAWLALRSLVHLVPPGTLRARTGMPAAIAAIFLIGFAFFGTEAFVPLTVVEVRSGSVTLGGVALSAAAVTWAIGSWLQARAAAMGLRRAVVMAGTALIVVGIIVTSAVLLPSSPVAVAAIGWGVAGLGMGLAYSMITLLVLEAATPGEEGFISAALALMFTLGIAFGAGVGGSIVALAEGGALDLVVAIGIINALMVITAAGSIAVCARTPSRATSSAHVDLAAAGLPLEHP